MKEIPSIFNSILSPVTVGPSSSNTSGPFRIGAIARAIAGGVTPKDVKLYLATSTRGALTFTGSRSDLAFVNGLLGKSIEDADFLKAYDNAQKEGLKISFDMETWEGPGTHRGHKIILTDKAGDTVEILADSIGGGAVRIFEIDKCKVDINGECYECLIYSLPENKIKIAEQVKNLLPGKNEVSFSECNGRTVLIEVKSQQPINADKLIKLINKDDILKIRYIHPINKMVPAGSEKVPFHSAKEMLAYAEKNHMNLYQTAVDYESNITGLSEDQILKNGHELWNIIKKSIDEGLAGNFNMNGIVTPKAKQFKESIDMKKTLPMGVMDIAGPIALGIMEYSNASGVIVCIPTGGSSGIVPACLYGTAKQLGSGENKIVEALLVSGILGVCMADDNHFSGGQYGCQAEVGCASAMAAGAVVYMLDGTAQQSCDAASMALQCLLGLVCDPVAGLVQVPCLARNISCAATSILSANAVISGFDVVVPFDEMFNALKAVGKIVCKSTGMGATNTPTGNRLKEKQLEKDILLRKQV